MSENTQTEDQNVEQQATATEEPAVLNEQDEQTRLESRLQELNAKPSLTQFEENQKRLIEDQLKTLRNTAAQQETMKQQQEQQVGGLVDMAQEIFEALFPSDIYTRKLGLSEYEEKRQDFYKAFHAASTDYVTSINDAHSADLAKRDDQNKALFDQLMIAEQENSEIKGQLHATVEQNTILVTENESLKSQLEQTKSELAAQTEEVKRLNGHVDALREKNKNTPASQPPIDITPSENGNLASVLGGIRERARKQYTNEELAQMGLGPRGVIMTVGTDNAPDTKAVNPFRPEVDPQSVAQGSDSGQAVTGEQFQAPAELPPVLLDVPAPTTDREVASETGTDVETRLAQLEARVTALENAKQQAVA